jgi:hypothetical protein
LKKVISLLGNKKVTIMATTVLNRVSQTGKSTENRVINWHLDDGITPTRAEFAEMVREAENGKGMTFEQYQAKVNVWLENNL